MKTVRRKRQKSQMKLAFTSTIARGVGGIAQVKDKFHLWILGIFYLSD